MAVTRENDLILLVSDDRKRYLLRLMPGKDWHTHRGRIAHDDLIGQPLGRTVETHTGNRFLLLEPSTADLIRNIKRTTQIIYPKDAAYIVLRLNLHCGRRVVEAGTGSGGLTLALARAVMTEGQVYSYEVRPNMLRLAEHNLDELGLLPYVTLKQRDISEGFDEKDVDALFLDLREPWLFVSQAEAALKDGGFFGSLLPTTNQVSQLLAALDKTSFVNIEVEELLLRPYKPVAERLRPADRMIAHTGYLVFARKVALGESEHWREHERSRRERRYLAQRAPVGEETTSTIENSNDMA